MYMYAINAISRGSKRNPSYVEPGRVFEPEDKEGRELLALNAVRKATEDEIAIARTKGHIAKGEDAEPTDDSGADDAAKAKRAEMEQRATELDVKFNKNLSDEKLAERIADAEKKNAGTGDDGLVG